MGKTPQDLLIEDAFASSKGNKGYRFSWFGPRVPTRIIIRDGDKIIVNAEVGYMRDGIITSIDGRMLGTYTRTIDYQPQEDGSRLNEILFMPVNRQEFSQRLRRRAGL